MNSEELATLWHFPIEHVVKAPMLQKASGRRAEAPMSLPVSEAPAGTVVPDDIFQMATPAAKPSPAAASAVAEKESSDVEEDIFAFAQNGNGASTGQPLTPPVASSASVEPNIPFALPPQPAPIQQVQQAQPVAEASVQFVPPPPQAAAPAVSAPKPATPPPPRNEAPDNLPFV
ncbi:hypothetical protein HGA64_03615 [Candidatus Falkowbacteria bacterium]|nr:hypothetical protein [Candidatus Falkowbacteria bacterium]